MQKILKLAASTLLAERNAVLHCSSTPWINFMAMSAHFKIEFMIAPQTAEACSAVYVSTHIIGVMTKCSVWEILSTQGG